MSPIDDRLLERWQTSRRHQDEARRFLARQRFSDPRGEGHALDEIVGTIADLEQTLRERAARRMPPPSSQTTVRLTGHEPPAREGSLHEARLGSNIPAHRSGAPTSGSARSAAGSKNGGEDAIRSSIASSPK